VASKDFVRDLKSKGMENVLKGFARTFSLDCEKNKTLNSTIYVPPFYTGVISLGP
jgi:hypothetical protein